MILLTYDISDKHTAFKTALLEIGYVDQVTGSTGVTNLPNTSLAHLSITKTPTQAMNDAQSTATKLGVILERCFANEYTQTGWNGIIGKPHQKQ